MRSTSGGYDSAEAVGYDDDADGEWLAGPGVALGGGAVAFVPAADASYAADAGCAFAYSTYPLYSALVSG